MALVVSSTNSNLESLVVGMTCLYQVRPLGRHHDTSGTHSSEQDVDDTSFEDDEQARPVRKSVCGTSIRGEKPLAGGRSNTRLCLNSNGLVSDTRDGRLGALGALGRWVPTE